MFVAAAAAVRNSDLVRRYAAPCEIPPEATEVKLRLVLRGTGAVKIGQIVLTNGAKLGRLPAVGRKRWIVLGAPAPRRGLPDLTRTWTRELPSLRIR